MRWLDGYDRLTRPEWPEELCVLVHCWSHLRRSFVKQMRNAKSPIAEMAVRQIAALYAVEATVPGLTPDVRRAVRRRQSALIIEALQPWLSGVVYPRLIERACRGPPEDVGGPWGHSDFLEAIAEP